MMLDQLNKAIALQAQIKEYNDELSRIDSIYDDYKKGSYTFEGIRLYSRLHNSVTLADKFMPITEVLDLYVARVKSKLSELQTELSQLITDAEPIKTTKR